MDIAAHIHRGLMKIQRYMALVLLILILSYTVFGQSDKDLAGSEDNFDDDSYYYNSRPLTDSQQQCCPCENRGKCKSCVCKIRGCNNCMNPLCQFKTNATVRFNPYAGRSARNVRADNQPSVNDTMAAEARPENVSDELECINLMAAVDNMSQDQMRAVLKASIAAGPEYMQRFVMGQQQATGQVSGSSNSNVPWCSCGVCHIFDDPRMNICCRQSPCITSKPEFRNLCLRHDVLEVANILNWSYRTNQDPSFSMSTFRNQAYRNFILWQHGRLGAGRRIPVPACVCRTVRQRFPEPNGQYTGYHSAHSDSD